LATITGGMAHTGTDLGAGTTGDGIPGDGTLAGAGVILIGVGMPAGAGAGTTGVGMPVGDGTIIIGDGTVLIIITATWPIMPQDVEVLLI